MNRLSIHLVLCLALIGGCFSAGCQRRVRQSELDLWTYDDRPGQLPDDLPTLTELRKHRPPRAPVDGGPEPRYVGAAGLRLMYPIDRDVRPALHRVDFEAFGEVQRELWRRNGMAVGVLAAGDLKEFVRSLGKTVGYQVSQARFVINDDIDGALPLVRTPPFTQRVELPVHLPGGEQELLTFSSGRLQLTTQYDLAPGGGVLRVFPHHFREKLSVRLREPHEIALDGRPFQELAIGHPVSRNLLLVITLAREAQTEPVGGDFPPEPHEEPSPGPSPRNPPSEEEAPPVPVEPPAIDTPPEVGALPPLTPPDRDTLGYMLLAGHYRRQLVQSVVIIRCPAR